MSRSPRHDFWHTRLPGETRDLPQRAWLADEGSLTARVASRCRKFSVALVRQELTRPNRDELRLLGLTRRESAWVREVVLKADGRPVVFAHSVLPRENVRGAWRLFAGMGGRPLGAALFADPRIERAPLQFRRLDARHPLWQAAARIVGRVRGELWARRSLFFRRGKPLLVTEVFLPDIKRLKP
ncbi:MAG: chorismate--pyruvate lyase [Rhodocyclaceae bacterium]|jgi:chorismate--pyruvate lyase|nr:chorismate--pyruvate lyase [Rhodocyclaceae bacterium]